MVSDETIRQVIRILIEEVGKEKTCKIAERLHAETTGNKSYKEITRVLDEMCNGEIGM